MSRTFAENSEELRGVLSRAEEYHLQIKQIAKHLKKAFKDGHQVLVAGNGGSAAEAQHLSDEMVGRYKKDRPAYPVIALTADTAVITCIGNDYGFDQIFARQVDALGRKGDVFIGLTTSGTSKNILAAASAASERGMTVVAFMGQLGTFKDVADYALTVPSETGARIQEMHLHAIHLLCEEFEE